MSKDDGDGFDLGTLDALEDALKIETRRDASAPRSPPPIVDKPAVRADPEKASGARADTATAARAAPVSSARTDATRGPTSARAAVVPSLNFSDMPTALLNAVSIARGSGGTTPMETQRRGSPPRRSRRSRSPRSRSRSPRRRSPRRRSPERRTHVRGHDAGSIRVPTSGGRLPRHIEDFLRQASPEQWHEVFLQFARYAPLLTARDHSTYMPYYAPSGGGYSPAHASNAPYPPPPAAQTYGAVPTAHNLRSLPDGFRR